MESGGAVGLYMPYHLSNIGISHSLVQSEVKRGEFKLPGVNCIYERHDFHGRFEKSPMRVAL